MGRLPRLDQAVGQQGPQCVHDLLLVDQCEPVRINLAVIAQSLNALKVVGKSVEHHQRHRRHLHVVIVTHRLVL